MTTSTIDVRPAESRYVTNIGWLDSRHSFSFGSHHDALNTGHGLLIVSNDDRVAAGGGFGTHGHRDMEIVTWVLNGKLEHQDSEGNHGVLYPGLAQRMSAGSGIRHSEMNASATEPVHFVQMWVPPDTTGIAPGYEQRDMNEALDAGGLVVVASGKGGKGHENAIRIHQAGAAMSVARLAAGETVTLPDAPFVHLFVARGQVQLAGRPDTLRPDTLRPDTLRPDTLRPDTLRPGDAARLTNAGTIELTAGDATEVIVWESDPADHR